MVGTTPFSAAGFDSSLLERPLGFLLTENKAPDESRKPLLKATLGVSLRTLDFDAFVKDYLSLMPLSIRDAGGTPKKRIYKSSHLTKQLAAKAPEVIRRLLSSLSDRIDRLDVYCFYSRREYISIYGTGRGERLSPNEFVELTQNAFPHVCAWRYLDNYKADSENDRLMIDHFQGKITPAWEAIEDGSFDIRVFYSGSECNPLISAADLTLRIIETYQRGNLDELSLLKPMEDQVPKLAGK